ncbi:MAG: protein translocase SEC61 complex subunit gamma [Candidatus Aenigmarchaeota archaeon]|nr:protein translocase SEC61 complex subunit gamma [Candidatus Aenigmarchaeota archaeon]
MFDIKSKIANCKRVLQIARKPSKDEFISSSKVSALGMFVIGMIGFVIFLVFVFLPL